MTIEVLNLPSMEHTFNVSIKCKETGKIYEGTFTYCRPNLRLKAEIAKHRIRLNGDLKTLDFDVILLNDMVSWLYSTIQKAPTWWTETNYGQDLYDISVLEEIYKACMDFEKEWYKTVYGDDSVKDDKKVEE